MKFIIHASIWDMIALLLAGGFIVIYFIVWAAAAWKERTRRRK